MFTLYARVGLAALLSGYSGAFVSPIAPRVWSRARGGCTNAVCMSTKVPQVATPALDADKDEIFPRLMLTPMAAEDVGGGKVRFTRETKLGDKVLFLRDIERVTEEGTGLPVFEATAMSEDTFHCLLDDDTSTFEDIIFYAHGTFTDPSDVFQRFGILQTRVSPDSHSKVMVVPVIWPTSEGWNIPLLSKLVLYNMDQETTEKAGDMLAKELAKFFVKYAPNPTRLHLVAHSMGNRLLRFFAENVPRSLVEQGLASNERDAMQPDGPGADIVESVTMIAADVPHDLFDAKENPEPTSQGRVLSTVSKRLVVMWAPNDGALSMSFVLNLGSRLGKTGASRETVSPFVTNLTNLRCDSFSADEDAIDRGGHGYQVHPKTLEIISTLLQGKTPTGELVQDPQ